MKILFSILVLFVGLSLHAQTNSYTVSLENPQHHQAVIRASFPDLGSDRLTINMGRSSPGRYALHEFAKNIYGFKATDSKGKPLKVHRPDPYRWEVEGHDGEVNIQYILFGDRGDGTYAQIDGTHAHLNIPATFMFPSGLEDRKIEVHFELPPDLSWKVATQLPLVSGTTYMAPNFQYFMDSPIEISDYDLRSFQVDGQRVEMALHHPGTEEQADAYFEKVKKVVLAQKEVFGTLPDFDYGRYTFLACYMPNASGDGMEHRNSTVLTSSRTLSQGGMERNIGTVSHEFFHAWNVERLRPKSLEPFDYLEANMSGELWFAEGFTSYYTNLILCRAGLMSQKDYVEGLTGTFNYVWNSPAREFFNPVEMSYQAPFVDAATSVDPVNRENTFISYYSYGSVLGLALDLSLREKELDLDGYFRLLWKEYGRPEIPYTIDDLQQALNRYAGDSFGDRFFDNFIHQSGMPDYESLLETVGVQLAQKGEQPYFGSALAMNSDGLGASLLRYPRIGSPAYEAGLDQGDIILDINGTPFEEGQKFEDYLAQFKIGETLKVRYSRYGKESTTELNLQPSKDYGLFLMEDLGQKPTKGMLKARRAWLKKE